MGIKKDFFSGMHFVFLIAQSKGNGVNVLPLDLRKRFGAWSILIFLTILAKIGWSQVAPTPCEGYEAYLTEKPETYPLFCLRVRLWVPLPPFPGVQFAPLPHHIQFLIKLIEKANQMLAHFETSTIRKADYKPEGYIQNPLRTLDTRIRLHLSPHPDTTLDPDQDGIIFFPTSSQWWYIPTTIAKENGERIPTQDSTLKRYQPQGFYFPFSNEIRDQTTFNVVLLAYPPELIRLIQEKKARALTHGWTHYYSHLLYLGGLFNRWHAQDYFYFQSESEFWQSCSDSLACLLEEKWVDPILTTYAGTLVHELFHAMGLRHITEPDEAGFQNVDCPDTPKIPKQQNFTNNIMEMGYYRGITLCQIALLWKHLLCHVNLRQKQCDPQTYIQLQDTFRLPMGTTAIWTIPIEIHSPIVLEPFSQLTIKKTTVTFDSSACILLHPHAQLILEDANLTASENSWKGILPITSPKGRKRGKKAIILLGNSKVEKAENPLK